MQHSFKYWVTSRGIFFLFLILCPSFYVSAQKQKQIEYLYKVVTKPSFVTPPLKMPKIPRYVPRACFPQLVPTNSSTFLGTLEWQVTKIDHKSVNLLSLPKESIPASIHDKPTTDPPFHNLLPIRSHSKPTFAPQEETRDWFDQFIKDLEIQDLLEDFDFDIDWEKECDELYYAIIIEIYGRAITDAA